MFTIERYFKDNEHYNNYFGIEGNALVDAFSIFWTDKVFFEKKLETLSDLFPELEDTLQSEDEPIILEIDYNLRRQKVTIPDYMNCLKTFINAAGSKHPKETLNDYILKIEPQFQNAQNKIDYCHIDGKDAVSFVKMRQEFVETILFGAYFYWDCEYEIRINDTNRDTYKQYANYYLDELAQFSGLPRENVREHDLFKVYDEMKRNFIKSFINTLNASTANTEVQLSDNQARILDRILNWTREIDWNKPANTNKVELLIKTLVGFDQHKLIHPDSKYCNLLWSAFEKTRGDGVAVVFQNILGRMKKKGLLKSNLKEMCSSLFDNSIPENNINKGVNGKVNKNVKKVIDFVDKYIEIIIFDNPES